MPVIELFITDHVRVEYNSDERIGYVTYLGRLTSETTSAVYSFLSGMTKNPETTLPLHGAIFDFRQVTDYDADNFATARSKSISLRLEHRDLMAQFPVGLIVETVEQEVMVQISMQLAKQGKNPRVRIFRSVDDARQFFDDWHAEHDTPAPADQPDDKPGEAAAQT